MALLNTKKKPGYQTCFPILGEESPKFFKCVEGISQSAVAIIQSLQSYADAKGIKQIFCGSLLLLWILWCFYAVTELTPRVEIYLTFYRWLTSWVLCLLPPSAIAAALVFRIKHGK